MNTLDVAYLRKALDYNPDTGEFIRKICLGGQVAGTVAGWMEKYGYIRIHIKGKSYLAHRLAWFYTHGYWPNEVDHRNRDKADNRLDNLREVTHSQNMHNTKLHVANVSGVKGVYWEKSESKWRAQIRIDGKCRRLGRFNSKEEAGQARKAAEEELL